MQNINFIIVKKIMLFLLFADRISNIKQNKYNEYSYKS